MRTFGIINLGKTNHCHLYIRCAVCIYLHIISPGLAGAISKGC
ncbi:hypothetical protein ACB092_06G063300 [Castanea dentata]